MKKIFLSLCLMAALICGTFAQAQKSAGQESPSTKEMLDKILNHTRKTVNSLGLSIPQSDSQAIEWVQLYQLTGSGDLQAPYKLGVMYAKGDGVEKNDQVALAWYYLALANGNKDVEITINILTQKLTAQQIDWTQRLVKRIQSTLQSEENTILLNTMLNPDFVVVSFKDGKVTRADLTAKENEFIARHGGKIEDLKLEQATILDWQIANRLVLEMVINAKAAELKSKIQPAVDAELADAKKKFGGDEKEFQKKLTESGLTEKDLVEQISQQEAIRYLIKQEKDAPAPVTEADAKAFYDNNKQLWNQEEQYSLRYIVVPLPANASDADKKQKLATVEAARKRVAGGEDFEKVAKEVDANNPQAGTTQQVPVGGFSPEFNKVVKTLKPGDISPVQEIGSNLLVFQLVSVKASGFDEVKGMIVKRLSAQKESEFTKRIIERLRDEVNIQFNIPDPNRKNNKTSPLG
jgi:parvulin-like peptidyl-prolyl isomerase